jgi:putative aldouronate transport system permease protein
MKLSRGEKIFQFFNYIIITIIVLTTLYPFLHVFSISLSTNSEAYRSGFHFIPIPGKITIKPYIPIFTSKYIWTGYLNTIIVTGAGTFLSLIIYSLIAYPLSKKDMPFNKLITSLLIFTMLFNGGLIPTYITMKNLGLLNTRLVLILQGVCSAFNIFIVRNFFKSIPKDLEESAIIDGASDFRVFFSIILPLSKPVMTTIGLWVGVWHWNSWFASMIYISDQNKQVLQVILRNILILASSDDISRSFFKQATENLDFSGLQVKSALIVVSVVPILIIYPFIQKYFEKGIMIGAVKG